MIDSSRGILLWICVFSGCLGLLACSSVGPPTDSSCLPCAQGSDCTEGFWCAHGFCLPKTGTRCNLSTEVKLRLEGNEGGESVKGCAPGSAAFCFDPKQPCSRGKTTCINGYWDECRDIQPDPKLHTPCSAGFGECEQKGQWDCRIVGEHSELFCNAVALTPKEERCNGKDDDCDGKIDEDVQESCYDDVVGTLRVGLCQSGIRRCGNGVWGPCEGQILPQEEVCDGQDNDCNGKVDEELKKSCYDGPANTDGVGLCRAGVQYCEKGKWTTCKGAVSPKPGEQCELLLNHTVTTSLLSCEARALARACDVGGACQQHGTHAKDESRNTDDSISLRCRGNHNEVCGVYSAEGSVRREVEAISVSGNVGIRLKIAGFAGSCSCNSWCRNGCNGQPGCCLTCDISAQECQASANYLAYHQLSWKKPIPTPYALVVEVEELNGGTPTFAIRGTPPNDGQQFFSLAPKQKCSLVLSNEGLTLQISNQVGLTCADSQEFSMQLVIRPVLSTEKISESCVSP